MVVTADDDVTPDMIVSSIEAALVRELDIHRSNVIVDYDEQSGEVTYSIESEDAEALVVIAEVLAGDEFLSSLESTIAGITIDTFIAPSDVIASVIVDVDASGVEDVDNLIGIASNAIEESNTAFSSFAKGNLCELWMEKPLYNVIFCECSS